MSVPVRFSILFLLAAFLHAADQPAVDADLPQPFETGSTKNLRSAKPNKNK